MNEKDMIKELHEKLMQLSFVIGITATGILEARKKCSDNEELNLHLSGLIETLEIYIDKIIGGIS